MQRVIAYVDGFNLYYGLRSKNWKWFYWLNIQEMARRMLKPGQSLLSTKYFTSVVSWPVDRHKRQATYLEALRTLSNFHIYYGHFLADIVTCRNCGHTYRTYHEKMTDVNIATELMSDAFQDAFDVALLVSADSDLVGPVQAVRRLFSRKRIVVAFSQSLAYALSELDLPSDLQ
ncbi:MAG: NYN domain-containing protein, partial [Anaerolineae bacterium]